jgi:hypothetical protein
VFIIRKVKCINKTSDICHSMEVIVWYAGLDGARGRTDTIDSPDDDHLVARNM